MTWFEATAVYAPGFRVLVDRCDVSTDVSSDITSLSVNDKMDAADECSITLSNRGLRWTESELFREGSDVEVKLGYHTDELQSVFSGEVTRLAPTFPDGGVPTLRVTAYGRFHRLTRSKRTRRFDDAKDFEIAQEVAEGVDLASVVEETATVRDYVLQRNQTDIEFLRELAERNHFVIRVIGNTLHFHKPHYDAAEACRLLWGRDLKSFEPTLNTANQVSRVIVRGWDPLAKEEIEGIAERGDQQVPRNLGSGGPERAEEAFGDSTQVVVDRSVGSVSEADELARAILNRTAETFITGRGSCVGRPEIQVDSVLRLEGLGRRFSGYYHVKSATHTLTQSGYLTSFEVRTFATGQLEGGEEWYELG